MVLKKRVFWKSSSSLLSTWRFCLSGVAREVWYPKWWMSTSVLSVLNSQIFTAGHLTKVASSSQTKHVLFWPSVNCTSLHKPFSLRNKHFGFGHRQDPPHCTRLLTPWCWLLLEVHYVCHGLPSFLEFIIFPGLLLSLKWCNPSISKGSSVAFSTLIPSKIFMSTFWSLLKTKKGNLFILNNYLPKALCILCKRRRSMGWFHNIHGAWGEESLEYKM